VATGERDLVAEVLISTTVVTILLLDLVLSAVQE